MGFTPAQICGVASPLPESMGCIFGVCNATTNLCVCREGFVDDTSFGSFNNCGMPAFWVDMCVWSSGGLSLLVLFITLANIGRLRNAARRAAQASCGVTLFHFFACVTYGVQGYASGTFILLAGFSVGMVMVSVTILVRQFFQASADSLKTTIPEARLKIAFGGMFVAGLIPFIVVSVAAYALIGTDDTYAYNKFIAAWFFLVPIHEVTFVPLFATIPRHLLKTAEAVASLNERALLGTGSHDGSLDGSKNAKEKTHGQIELASFIRRLRIFELVTVRVMIPSICVSMWGMFILYMVLGQIPFQFLMFGGVMFGLPACSMATLIVTTKRFWRPFQPLPGAQKAMRVGGAVESLTAVSSS